MMKVSHCLYPPRLYNLSIVLLSVVFVAIQTHILVHLSILVWGTHEHQDLDFILTFYVALSEYSVFHESLVYFAWQVRLYFPKRSLFLNLLS